MMVEAPLIYKQSKQIIPSVSWYLLMICIMIAICYLVGCRDDPTNPSTLSETHGEENLNNTDRPEVHEDEHPKRTSISDNNDEVKKNTISSHSSLLKARQNQYIYEVVSEDIDEWEEQIRRINFVCYHPSAGNPNQNDDSSIEEVHKDLALAHRTGFTGLITYTANGVQGLPLVAAAESIGFKAIIIGVWDCKDTNELATAKTCGKSPIVLGYSIGNEGFQKRYSFVELSTAITDIRQATGKKVTTTEEIDDYYSEPRLFEISDWIFCNAHPYWHSRVEPKSAVQWTIDAYEDMKTRTNKFVLFKEVGMPTAGDTKNRVSEFIQDEYYRLLADSEVQFAYFEFCDQTWKKHHPVEPYWGVYRSDRSPKRLGYRLLKKYCQEDAAAVDSDSPPNNHIRRPMLSTDDSFSVDLAYTPSGILGDVGDVRISDGNNGSTLFTYAPRGRGPHEWDRKYVNGKLNKQAAQNAGVLWLSPANDFGSTSSSGYDLSQFKPNVIRWEARSLSSPITVKFFIGGVAWKWVQEYGVHWTRKPVSYPDSVPYMELGIRFLDSEWQTFEAYLPEKFFDFRRLVGGFGWTASWEDNRIDINNHLSREFQFEIRNICYLSIPLNESSNDNEFYVYHEADSAENHYVPSGYMGDTGDIRINQIWQDNPHSGKTCMRVIYEAKGIGPNTNLNSKWAGIYWQQPPNNWGEYEFWGNSGYNLSSYQQLRFWARAEKPCFIEFFVGGINAQHGDSLKFPRMTSAFLTNQWKEYTINLSGADLHKIIGGFGWTASQDKNPHGATFYLDDIRFLKE